MHQDDDGDAAPDSWGIIPYKPRPRARADWSVEEVIDAGICPWCRSDVVVQWSTGALYCVRCMTHRPFHEAGIFFTSPDAHGVTVDPTKGDDGR